MKTYKQIACEFVDKYRLEKEIENEIALDGDETEKIADFFLELINEYQGNEPS